MQNLPAGALARRREGGSGGGGYLGGAMERDRRQVDRGLVTHLLQLCLGLVGKKLLISVPPRCWWAPRGPHSEAGRSIVAGPISPPLPPARQRPRAPVAPYKSRSASSRKASGTERRASRATEA